MTAGRAVTIRKNAIARWGRKPPKEIAEPLNMLVSLGMMKPESILGPTLNDAALAVSRRLREDK